MSKKPKKKKIKRLKSKSKLRKKIKSKKIEESDEWGDADLDELLED